MTHDQIPADKLREVIDKYSAGVLLTSRGLRDDLQALLPAPDPRKTLADMTDEERQACQFMQCELEGDDDERPVIIWSDDSESMVVYPDGRYAHPDLEHVVPLPHLPRLEWPASEPEDPYEEFMDFIEEGVNTSTPKPSIDTSATINDGNNDAPHPEDVPDGYWLITHPYEVDPVPAEKVADQWWIVGRGGMLPAAEVAEITIVSRLSPTSPPPTTPHDHHPTRQN